MPGPQIKSLPVAAGVAAAGEMGGMRVLTASSPVVVLLLLLLLVVVVVVAESAGPVQAPVALVQVAPVGMAILLALMALAVLVLVTASEAAVV